MNRKSILAACGILLVFGMVVSGQAFAQTLASQPSSAAGPGAPAGAPGLQNPSALPPTATDSGRIFLRTLPGLRTLFPPVPFPVETITTQPPAPATATASSTPAIIVTPTNTERFQPSDTPPPPPTDTPVPMPNVIPVITQPVWQPDTATPVPTPTDTLPPAADTPTEPSTLAATQTVVQAPGAISTAVTQPATPRLPAAATQTAAAMQPGPVATIVYPAETDEEGVVTLPFTVVQLQMIGIAAFLILDVVLLGILFRWWNKRRGR